MAASFFFYDLETTGFNPRTARAVQFAGQRTDQNLQPVEEPINIFIKLTPDVLPDPDAALITGITPQKTIAEGVTEAKFMKFFYDEIVRPDTIFVGYNNVRFDDEFMRFLHWRNFYDPYEWHWKNACSRWDMLDVVRMTRALRPEGIEWPYASDGKPTNRLEFLTKLNKLDHYRAHDALSDVRATIAVANLIKTKQPDLFRYLLDGRNKKKSTELILQGKPLVYTSGRYGSQYLHTSVAVLLARHAEQEAALVYDLRVDPAPFLQMSVDEIVEAWRYTRDPEVLRLPVKTVKYNRCPAVAPLGVIKDEAVQQRLQLPLATVTKHLELLKRHQADFAGKIFQAVQRLDAERRTTDQASLVDDPLTVDERLYEGFPSDADKSTMRALRAASPAQISRFTSEFHDRRLQTLLPLYKARNYPQALTPEEQATWDDFCRRRLQEGGSASRLARYFARLEELAAGKLTGDQQYILEELQLYGQSFL